MPVSMAIAPANAPYNQAGPRFPVIHPPLHGPAPGKEVPARVEIPLTSFVQVAFRNISPFYATAHNHAANRASPILIFGREGLSTRPGRRVLHAVRGSGTRRAGGSGSGSGKAYLEHARRAGGFLWSIFAGWPAPDLRVERRNRSVVGCGLACGRRQGQRTDRTIMACARRTPSGLRARVVAAGQARAAVSLKWYKDGAMTEREESVPGRAGMSDRLPMSAGGINRFRQKRCLTSG